MTRLLGLIAAMVASLLPLEAQALDKKRPIRVVTAFPAGGVTDIGARIVSDALARELGVTIVVENKPGGDGIIGISEVVNAPPDGNTLLSGGFGGQLIPPLIKKNFPFNIRTQLTFIARTAGFSNILVVANNVPVKSVAEFIAYAKARPNELNFGTAASTSSDRLTTEMFMQRTGVKMTRIPYKGSGPAMNDLNSGVIQVMFANVPAAVGLISGKKIRALAVTSASRVPQLPDLPTLQEEGLSDFDVTSWLSVFGPAKMAAEDVKLLSEGYARVSKKPEVVERLAKVGFVPIGEGAEAFKATFEKEWTRWKAVIEAARLVE